MTRTERVVIACDRTVCTAETPAMDTARDAETLAAELGWTIRPITLCPPCRADATARLDKILEDPS